MPHITDQIEAIERVIKPEGRLTLNSKKLKQVKEWKTGEDYEVKMTIHQENSNELEDGTIESRFEVKNIKVV